MQVWTRVLAACAAVGLASAIVYVPLRGADPEPVRILVVGDSIAQGSAGDWTWRYRAWDALKDAGAEVDFVGPHQDLYDNVTGLPGATSYADPDFDRDHAAQWGVEMGSPDVSLPDLVERYRPDVVVEARGVNDLSHGIGADVLTRTFTAEVAAARDIDPDVDFVVAELPQTWVDDASAYNAGLPGVATALTDDDSHVEVAATGAGFTQGTDTWDPAHLTASGELKMAAGVVDALAALGVGDEYPRPLPEVTNGHWEPPTHVGIEAGDGQVDLSWTGSPGCPLVYIWSREVGVDADWVRMDDPVSGTTRTVGLLTNGHTYEYRLQPAKGLAVGDTSSEVVSATPEAIAVPGQPPPAPTGVVADPGPDRLVVGWDVVDSATSYDVVWVGAGTSGSATVAGPPYTIGGLAGGESYEVTVTARNDDGSGPGLSVFATPTVS